MMAGLAVAPTGRPDGAHRRLVSAYKHSIENFTKVSFLRQSRFLHQNRLAHNHSYCFLERQLVHHSLLAVHHDPRRAATVINVAVALEVLDR